MFDAQILVPFPETFPSAPLATGCRSTLLIASLASIQRGGHRGEYEKNISRPELAGVETAVAGVWLPIDLAVAHYRACDALHLSTQEQLDLGAEVVTRTTRSLIGTVLVAAKSAGAVTVWSMLAKFGQVYARNFQGGGARVTRIGPKDARIEVAGLPLAGISYFRVAYLGSLRASVELFATRSVVSEVSDACTKTTLTFRASWV